MTPFLKKFCASEPARLGLRPSSTFRRRGRSDFARAGEGADGRSVAAGEGTLDAGSGGARRAVTGTPTTFGEVLFKVAVELGDKSFGPYEVKSETANRMAAPTGLYVFRADSHEIIMEWDNDHRTERTRKWAWQLQDSDADDAGVVREFTYVVNSNDDKNP